MTARVQSRNAAAVAKRVVWRGLKGAARTVGIDIVRRHYYSPIPDVRALPGELWERPSPMHGVDFDVERQFALLEGPLAPFVEEATRELRPGGPLAAASAGNLTYGSVDLEILYAWMREGKPARVVELGSGVSSLVIQAALERNRSEGAEADHRIFDPYSWHAGLDGGGVTVTPRGATDVPLEEFRRLSTRDVLFVDTTHTVRTGGDVTHIVLEVLPLLAPGVTVHFHDIYLPWEYPRSSLEKLEYYWAEQYLLQAFLAFNRQFETLLAHHAMKRADLPRLARMVPSSTAGGNPSALWLRRADPAG